MTLGPAGVLNISVLERFDSGRPFSAILTVVPNATPGSPLNTTNPAAGDVRGLYHNPPQQYNYWVGERGRFRWKTLLARTWL